MQLIQLTCCDSLANHLIQQEKQIPTNIPITISREASHMQGILFLKHKTKTKALSQINKFALSLSSPACIEE